MAKGNHVSSRILEFEALRALSIILLLPLHSGIFDFHVLGVYLGPFAAYVGAFLLGSFFFLAGYFADGSFRKSGVSFFSFLWSKIIRIFPPYWLSLALFVFVLGFSLSRRELLVYILNLQFLFSPTFVKQVLTLWFVSIVLVYFVIFGFLLSRKISNLILFVWSLAVFGVSYLIYRLTGLFDGRFFEYFFIFLAGIYFSRIAGMRERVYALHFVIKILFAIIGAGLFWLAQSAQLFLPSLQYLLAVDVYILSWILLWLDIFRSPVGGWRIWGIVSYASFFAYLFHRPIWYGLNALFVFDNWQNSVLFIVFPGSVIVFTIAYLLQFLYDRLLSLFRNRDRSVPEA